MPCQSIPNPANDSVGSNPYASILNASVRQEFSNLIDVLVSDAGCTLPCKLFYSSAKCIDCENCISNPMIGGSSGVYQSGGPIPFGKGMTCPLCVGKGKIHVEESEELNLVVIWDSKEFVKLGLNKFDHPKVADGFAQTLCRIEWYWKIMNTEYVILNLCDECLNQKYKRITIPEPCGFCPPKYILTLWQLQ